MLSLSPYGDLLLKGMGYVPHAEPLGEAHVQIADDQTFPSGQLRWHYDSGGMHSCWLLVQPLCPGLIG
ncbi:hypothetical protein EGJ42_13495 [Stutzerimonas stutzeri]|nr:hypothetical protein EGJ42_13495 [Stutzerimonas stutzeri]